MMKTFPCAIRLDDSGEAALFRNVPPSGGSMIGYTQQVGPAICCAIGQSATMVSILWGS